MKRLIFVAVIGAAFIAVQADAARLFGYLNPPTNRELADVIENLHTELEIANTQISTLDIRVSELEGRRERRR
jgi:hypothetical protein